MPTYEYACSSCKHEWEFEQSIKEDPIKECPSCHQLTAKRQISRGTGFILKGSGWYADLYSSPSNKAADSGKKSDTPPSEGSGSSGSSGSSSSGSGSSSGGTSSGSTPTSSSASPAAA